jgi:hypothetical protein
MGGGVANGSVLSVEGGGATLEARAFARGGRMWRCGAPNIGYCSRMQLHGKWKGYGATSRWTTDVPRETRGGVCL